MSAHRIFVVRVIRRTGTTEVLGVVEQVASLKRLPFRTADDLWRIVASPLRRTSRATPRDNAASDGTSSLVDETTPQRSK